MLGFRRDVGRNGRSNCLVRSIATATPASTVHIRLHHGLAHTIMLSPQNNVLKNWSYLNRIHRDATLR